MLSSSCRATHDLNAPGLLKTEDARPRPWLLAAKGEPHIEHRAALPPLPSNSQLEHEHRAALPPLSSNSTGTRPCFLPCFVFWLPPDEGVRIADETLPNSTAQCVQCSVFSVQFGI
jgi:hypothetical protein